LLKNIIIFYLALILGLSVLTNYQQANKIDTLRMEAVDDTSRALQYFNDWRACSDAKQ
jgi:hypothetical protein